MSILSVDNIQPIGSGTSVTVNSVATLILNNANIAGVTTFGGDLAIADKIRHIGDSNTAIRFPSNDTVTIETSGSEKVRITSAGKVGVGTDMGGAPASSYPFGVYTTGTGYLYTETSGSGASAGLRVKAGTSDFTIYSTQGTGQLAVYDNTNTAERLRIDSSGNVLAGTTDTTIYNNGDSASEGIVLRGGKVIDIARKGDLQLTLNRQTNDGPHIAFYRSGVQKSLISTRSNSFCIDVNASERLRIISTGEVGINMTPSNGQMLAITGRSGYDDIMQVTAVGTNIGARINLTNTGTGVARINATNNDLALQTSGTSRLHITSAGKIGIGNANPQSKLSVSDAGSTSDPVIMAHVSGSNGGILGFGLYSDVNSKYTFKVTNNGRVQVNDGIDFSLTSNAAGMTSELLDDYEEGVFTITAGSGSNATFNSSNNQATYTKIGRQVTIAGQCRLSGGSGNVRIALPFNSAPNGSDEDMSFAASVIGYDYNAQSSSNCDGLFILIDANVSYGRFMEHRNNNSWTSLDVDTNGYLRFTITYFTT